MVAPLTIRPSDVQDIETIRTLAHKVWWAHYPGILSDEEITLLLEKMYAPEALRAQMAGSHQYFLGLENDQPLGFISVEPRADTLFIHRLYVDMASQSQGIGSALMFAACASFPDATHATLYVNRNNHQSIGYYKHRGFEITREVDDDSIAGAPIKHDYEMVCTLPLARKASA